MAKIQELRHQMRGPLVCALRCTAGAPDLTPEKRMWIAEHLLEHVTEVQKLAQQVVDELKARGTASMPALTEADIEDLLNGVSQLVAEAVETKTEEEPETDATQE